MRLTVLIGENKQSPSQAQALWDFLFQKTNGKSFFFRLGEMIPEVQTLETYQGFQMGQILIQNDMWNIT